MKTYSRSRKDEVPVLLLERELPACKLPVLKPATLKPSAKATAAGAPIFLPRLTLALIVDITASSLIL